MRDPEHDSTLAAIFGGETLTPESQEWFAWLASIPSFAFEGRAGRFTARRETKQRGESYWVAYQRAGGKLLKRYLGRTSDLTAEKLEATARSMSARPASPACTDAPAAAPPTPTSAPHAWELIPGQVMDIDIGKAPKGPPYDDIFWLPDRSHFPRVQPTKERCPIHPTACWLLRDPSGQAWRTHPTCWQRYNLMRLGGLINYLIGCDRDTHIATGAQSWATYACEQDDTHIEFSLQQAIMYCMNLDLQWPDLSED